MIQGLRKEFNTRIMKLPVNYNVKMWLKSHERKELALTKLAEQIEICERRIMSVRFELSQYNVVIDSFIKLFVELAMKHAEQSIVSRLEKQRRIDQHNKLNEFEAEAEEEYIKDTSGLKKFYTTAV